MSDDNGKIFDRRLLKLRRDRSAAQWRHYDFLKREAQERLGECLADITRGFPRALNLGCHSGGLMEALKGRGGIKTLVECDLAEKFLPDIVCDEEYLPFAENSFDLVLSALSLHHVNDLPGALIQIKRALKPDGLFLALLPGAGTLKELRASIVGASAEHGFALSPRISPFVEIRDAGALLMRAGFALPVADSDTLTVEYNDAFRLMADLRGMGESNVLLGQRRTFTPRQQMAAIADYYHTHFAGENGAVPATFEFVTLTAWKPHPAQQQPAKRGSGRVHLKQAL
jgi:SAM-dependent methyltransferase